MSQSIVLVYCHPLKSLHTNRSCTGSCCANALQFYELTFHWKRIQNPIGNHSDECLWMRLSTSPCSTDGPPHIIIICLSDVLLKSLTNKIDCERSIHQNTGHFPKTPGNISSDLINWFDFLLTLLGNCLCFSGHCFTCTCHYILVTLRGVSCFTREIFVIIIIQTIVLFLKWSLNCENIKDCSRSVWSNLDECSEYCVCVCVCVCVIIVVVDDDDDDEDNSFAVIYPIPSVSHDPQLIVQ